MTLEVVSSHSTSTSEDEATVTDRPFRMHWRTWPPVRIYPLAFDVWEMALDQGAAAKLLAAPSDRWIVRLVHPTPARDEYGENLILAFRQGVTLRRSEQLRSRARRALEANREPDDLDAWARRLAEDTADAID